MRAKGNPAEFAGALLSISVQQDFTGCSYRDTLVQHWRVRCQKGVVPSLPHAPAHLLLLQPLHQPYCSGGPTADWIRKLIKLEKDPPPHFLTPASSISYKLKNCIWAEQKKNPSHKCEGCSPDCAAPTLINTPSLKPAGRIQLTHTMNISSPINDILIWAEEAPRGLAQSREVSSS